LLIKKSFLQGFASGAANAPLSADRPARLLCAGVGGILAIAAFAGKEKTSMSATNIRRASANDAATVAHIINEAWKTAYAGVVPLDRLDALSDERKAAQLREGLIRFPEMRYYLFEANGIPVGAASLHPTHDADLPGAAEFSFFYFLPSVWRRGYGKQLLAHLKSEAASLGYDRLCCWVLEQNRRAIAFYESQDMPCDGKRQTVTIGIPLEALRCTTNL